MPSARSAHHRARSTFFGTRVVSGAATYFGSMATHLADTVAVPSSFDQGLNGFTWLLLRFTAVMDGAAGLSDQRYRQGQAEGR